MEIDFSSFKIRRMNEWLEIESLVNAYIHNRETWYFIIKMGEPLEKRDKLSKHWNIAPRTTICIQCSHWMNYWIHFKQVEPNGTNSFIIKLRWNIHKTKILFVFVVFLCVLRLFCSQRRFFRQFHYNNYCWVRLTEMCSLCVTYVGGSSFF